MRRLIHSLIVAVLCLTLGIDTAKACWFLRHRSRSHLCRPAACPPACPAWCSEPVAISDQPVVEQECLSVETKTVVEAVGDVVEISTDPQGDSGGEDVIVHGATQVLDIRQQTPTPAAEPVVTLPAVAEEDTVVAAQPMPREAAMLPAAAQEPLPVLQPAIAPASNEQPVPEAPTVPPVQTLALKPQEVNLFDLNDDKTELPADIEEAVDAREPEMAEDEAEPADSEPADSEPADDNATEPAEEPAAAEAADPADAAVVTPGEPLRLWTNATGSDQAQGWLVELHADSVRILKVNGRHTMVSLDALSAADRDYISEVAAQQASQSGVAAATSDTAGL